MREKINSKKNHLKKTIYIVGSNGLPVRYGGWDMFLDNFTKTLSRDYKIFVYTSIFESVKGLKSHNGAFIKLVPLKANGFQSIFYDFFTMLDASFRGADYILVLGYPGGIFFPIFKLFKSKVILNPDGVEWQRSKFGNLTKFFLKLSEKIGTMYADKVIADNKVIADDLLKKHGVVSKVIEYGADHSSQVDLRNSTASKYSIKKNNYAFKVCRIVPENNIRMILEEFSKTKYKLLLIGNWKNSKFGIDLRKEYSDCQNLSLLDPIYDQEELDELRSNCRLYIHGHSVGGTNPSLVEAMYLGLPCLVFDVNYNRETTEEAAKYFKTSVEFQNALKILWESDELLYSMSKKLKNIALRRFEWKEIIMKYKYLIENIS